MSIFFKTTKMNKVKFKVKVTGFEMEFEGTREDMKQVSSTLGQQLTSFIPASFPGVQEGRPIESPQVTEDAEATVIQPNSNGKRTRKGKSVNSSGAKEKAAAIDFTNDVSANGAPTQKWTTLDKAMWILHVIEVGTSLKELTVGQIAETFNKYYKQQGTIRGSNVSRDLRSKKAGSNALVGENPSTKPHTWFLTDEGKKSVLAIIKAQKMEPTK
jgi:hypothetical protein